LRNQYQTPVFLAYSEIDRQVTMFPIILRVFGINDVFSEYESVVKNAIQEESEQPIIEFMATYKNEVTFPGGTIDGAPNLTIEPKVSTLYLSVANTNGKFILGAEIVDGTKTMTTSLKSVNSFTCDKKHDKRKMHIRLTVDDPNFSYNVAEVTHEPSLKSIFIAKLFVNENF